MLHPASTFLRQDPFALMRRMSRDFDRTTAGPLAGAGARTFPAINVWQGSDSAAITAELPGVEAEDIDIAVKDDVVTLSGERKAPEAAEGAVWRMRERSFGKFSRAVRLPFRVDPNKVEARFVDGVLQIALHRPEEDKPRRIKIKAA